MSKLTPAQISHAKSLGFLQNRGTNCFSGRAITKNGVLSAEQLKNLAECAEQYGNGTVTFTTRLTVEIPGIPFEHIDNVRNHVAKQNMGEQAPKYALLPLVKVQPASMEIVTLKQLRNSCTIHFLRHGKR